MTLPVKFVVGSSAYIPFANGTGKDYLKTNTKKIKAAMPKSFFLSNKRIQQVLNKQYSTSVNNQRFSSIKMNRMKV